MKIRAEDQDRYFILLKNVISKEKSIEKTIHTLIQDGLRQSMTMSISGE